ncbi:MAG: glycosyl transferase [Kibdelosporangium sp.]
MVLPRTTRRTKADAIVMVSYLSAAVLLYGLLWTNLESGYLTNSVRDQNLFEWFLAVAAHDPGLVSTLLNHPAGVNMMANTSVLGLGIPLAPVTWLFGPTVTWAVVLTGGIAGSAAAWYWVISRHLVRSTAGAAIGGAFCAFAPPMVSHANAHPNFVALFVIPFIVSRLIVLPGNPVRHGVVLGILVAYQVFLGEEPLLIAAIALVVHACVQRSVVTRALCKGLGIAAAVALSLLAYPLWVQFAGPQSYSRMGHGGAGNDLASMTMFASDSLAGDPAVAGRIAINRTEESAFFGWPLVILVVVLGIWLWPVARALVVTAVSMAVLSLGWELVIHGLHTGIPLPWRVLSQLPLLDSVLGARLSMACVPVIGILIATGWQRISLDSPHARLLWLGMLSAALLPIVPVPLEVSARPATPPFFTDGTWRQHVQGGSVVVVPLPSPDFPSPMHWQVAAGMGFPLAEGYFVGPGSNGEGHYGAVRTKTSQLLADVADTGDLPVIGPAERAQAAADIGLWRADAVVLGPHPRQGALYQACRALFGVGRHEGGVWVWSM